VTLPRLGTIRTHEPTRKLSRRLESGSARILSATVSRTAQRWFVSFTVEVDRAVPGRHARPGTVIGIDLGVKTLLTGADNTGNVITVGGPKPLRAARIHARVANARADALHKATSMLARDYETVVTEDLNVAGMTRNRPLARATADQGFGQARRMLAYKTVREGGTLIVADRWYPSSKTCSGCGQVKATLPLSERTYRCEACGLVLDRDVNAARNLLSLAASGADRVNACGGTVRPGRAGHVPVKQEPGTRQRDQTGTVPRQHGTAA
jgi:putative transposase